MRKVSTVLHKARKCEERYLPYSTQLGIVKNNITTPRILLEKPRLRSPQSSNRVGGFLRAPIARTVLRPISTTESASLGARCLNPAQNKPWPQINEILHLQLRLVNATIGRMTSRYRMCGIKTLSTRWLGLASQGCLWVGLLRGLPRWNGFAVVDIEILQTRKDLYVSHVVREN